MLMGLSVFSAQMGEILTFASFFYFRWKQPDIPRPVKVIYFLCKLKQILKSASTRNDPIFQVQSR